MGYYVNQIYIYMAYIWDSFKKKNFCIIKYDTKQLNIFFLIIIGITRQNRNNILLI